MGFDRYGNFFYRPKGGVQARVQSSAPATIEFKDATHQFPNQGMIAINNELVSYDGIFGRQFLNLERGQHGTTLAGHCPNSVIYLISNVLNTGESLYDDVRDADVRDTSRTLFNKVIVTYDDDKKLEFQDDASILIFGEKIYEMELPLSIHQVVWIEQIAKRFLAAHKDMHYLITIRINETFDIKVADVVFLQIPERARLTRTCQVYEVTINPMNRETGLVLRTL